MAFLGLESVSPFSPSSLAFSTTGQLLWIQEARLISMDLKNKKMGVIPLNTPEGHIETDITHVGVLDAEGELVLASRDISIKPANSDLFRKVSNLGLNPRDLKTSGSSLLAYSDHSFNLTFVKNQRNYNKKGTSDTIVCGDMDGAKGILLFLAEATGSYVVDKMELEDSRIRHDKIFINTTQILTKIWLVGDEIFSVSVGLTGEKNLCRITREGVTDLLELRPCQPLTIQDVQLDKTSGVFYVLTERTLMLVSAKSGLIIQHLELLGAGSLNTKKMIVERGGRYVALVRDSGLYIGEFTFTKSIDMTSLLRIVGSQETDVQEAHVGNQIAEIFRWQEKKVSSQHGFLKTFNRFQSNLLLPADPYFLFKKDAQRLESLKHILEDAIVDHPLIVGVYMGPFVVGVAKLKKMQESNWVGFRLVMNPYMKEVVLCEDSFLGHVLTHLISYSLESPHPTENPAGLFLTHVEPSLLRELSNYGSAKREESKIGFTKRQIIRICDTEMGSIQLSKIFERPVNNKRSLQQRHSELEVIKKYLADSNIKLIPANVDVDAKYPDSIGAFQELLLKFTFFPSRSFVESYLRPILTSDFTGLFVCFELPNESSICKW